MAVLIAVDVAGQTREGYDGMLAVLAEPLRQAPGFLFHGSYQDEAGGWHVVEVWAQQQDADRFFAAHVAPNLPPGVRPKRKTHALIGCVTPQATNPLTSGMDP